MAVPATPDRTIVPVPGYPGLFVRSWKLTERVAFHRIPDADNAAYLVRWSLCDADGDLALTTLDEANERDSVEAMAVIREALRVNRLNDTADDEKKD